MAIQKEHIITKRNVLNELRSNSMTLQELRFFSIYLSKINSNDIRTRNVRFSLSEFEKIMEFDSRVKVDYLKNVTNSLLCKVVNVPLNEKGGYTAFQLFKECTVNTDQFGEWYIEIDAHDKALPLMFEFKNKYFTYQLWNALRLKSTNQLRMYEILKQYEKVGERIISLDELKELLGIKKDEYTLFNNFKKRVLDSCQKALKENTDIHFTYEPIRRKGKGGKIQFLKFKIRKNKEHIDQLSLEDFMNMSTENPPEPLDPHQEEQQKRLIFWAESCNNEFSPAQIQILYNLIIKILPAEKLKSDTEVYDYLKLKYDELLHRAEQTNIKHRFNYFQKMLKAEMV